MSKIISEKKILTYSESLALGAITGATEVSVNLPLWTLKMRMQCNLPFTLNPFILYKSYLVSTITMASITSLQFSSNAVIERCAKGDNKNISSQQRTISAFFGGALSSVILNPINLIGTQQHKHKYDSYFFSAQQTFKKIRFKGLYLGTPMTALTDGLFISAYYGAYPYLKKLFSEKINNDFYAAIAAGFTTGTVAATLSHPLDVIKTQQHRNAEITSKTAKDCINELWQKRHGIGFFTGYVPRTLMLISSITVAGATSESVEPYVTKRKF